ncbi:MAG: Gfo/Idh/MocA family oxidoreductase [Chloroflexi bacterium]|nr:Gfo/Idh/MocA family oxidoreductase [Chloroflexota bacterium]
MGLKIGIVGLSFGADFIPLFRAHPLVREVLIADLLPERVQYARDLYGALPAVRSLHEMLASDVDAVCIFTQRWMHAPQAIRALRAGKHVYSAVPAAITCDEMAQLIEAVKTTGQMYMMGETSYYYPSALYCRARFARGDFGRFVYGEAEYMHDMTHGFYEAYQWANGDAWKKYASFPPMLYPTHSVSMITQTTDARLTRVSCLGYTDSNDDGVFERDVSAWGNVFSNETALFRTSNGGMARVNEFRRIGWSETPRCPSVRLSLYGTEASYEEQGNSRIWNTRASDEPQDVTDLLVCEQVQVRDAERANLPEELIYDYHTGLAKIHPHQRLPLEFGGLNNGHEGSHQFLVDDFVNACVTMKLPPNHVWAAARNCVPGIVAHESAMREGESLAIPDFGDAPGE